MNKWNAALPEDLRKEARFVAVLTDSVRCGFLRDGALVTDPADGGSPDESKLLEIRVFNSQKEYRAFREYRTDDFLTRLIDDTGRDLTPYYNVYDEEQLLDAVHSETPGSPEFTRFAAEGGGVCSVPGKNVGKVLLRTYIAEDPSTGLSWAGDWRIVEFKQ